MPRRHRAEARRGRRIRPAKPPFAYDEGRGTHGRARSRRGRRRRGHGVGSGPVADDGGSVDVLFVDEAGQLSLANTVAISRAATSLVLLGDPQQLEQPIQGIASARRRGVGPRASARQPPDDPPTTWACSCETTWRMHPAICRVHVGDVLRRAAGPAWHDPSGAWPGRQQASAGWRRHRASLAAASSTKATSTTSDEEADAIAAHLPATADSDARGSTRRADARRSTGRTSSSSRPTTPQVAISSRIACGRAVTASARWTSSRASRRPSSIYSLTTSAPTSRPAAWTSSTRATASTWQRHGARALAIVVGSPALLDVVAHSPTRCTSPTRSAAWWRWRKTAERIGTRSASPAAGYTTWPGLRGNGSRQSACRRGPVKGRTASGPMTRSSAPSA